MEGGGILMSRNSLRGGGKSDSVERFKHINHVASITITNDLKEHWVSTHISQPCCFNLKTSLLIPLLTWVNHTWFFILICFFAPILLPNCVSFSVLLGHHNDICVNGIHQTYTLYYNNLQDAFCMGNKTHWVNRKKWRRKIGNKRLSLTSENRTMRKPLCWRSTALYSSLL